MSIKIALQSAEFKDVDGEGRWCYTILAFQDGEKISTVTKRYSEIRGLHERLEKANTLLGGLKLPDFPSWFRIKAGYTNYMNKEQISKRMDELEKYLNELSSNAVALSTKYFVDFIGLDMKGDKDRIVQWINWNKGYIQYQKTRADNEPLRSTMIKAASRRTKTEESSQLSKVPKPNESEADVSAISQEADIKKEGLDSRANELIRKSDIREGCCVLIKQVKNEEQASEDNANIDDDEDADISDEEDTESAGGRVKSSFVSVQDLLKSRYVSQYSVKP